MRARNIKPSVFRNDLLAAADPLCTVVFAGLWCMADRDGRLEDRPARIHIEINPCRAYEGTQAALNWLEANAFIERYAVGDVRVIQVTNFQKHQNPHHREPLSLLPARGEPRAKPRRNPAKPQSGPSPAVLIPDSGFSDSGFSDSGFLNPSSKEEGRTPAARARALPPDFELTEDRRVYAEKTLPNVDAGELMAAFRDYHSAKGTTARDWDACWRTYVRNGLKFGYPMPVPSKSPPAKIVRIDPNGRVINA